MKNNYMDWLKKEVAKTLNKSEGQLCLPFQTLRYHWYDSQQALSCASDQKLVNVLQIPLRIIEAIRYIQHYAPKQSSLPQDFKVKTQLMTLKEQAEKYLHETKNQKKYEQKNLSEDQLKEIQDYIDLTNELENCTKLIEQQKSKIEETKDSKQKLEQLAIKSAKIVSKLVQSNKKSAPDIQMQSISESLHKIQTYAKKHLFSKEGKMVKDFLDRLTEQLQDLRKYQIKKQAAQKFCESSQDSPKKDIKAEYKLKRLQSSQLVQEQVLIQVQYSDESQEISNLENNKEVSQHQDQDWPPCQDDA